MKKIFSILMLALSVTISYAQATSKQEVVKNEKGMYVVRVTAITEYPCDTALLRQLDESITTRSKERDGRHKQESEKIRENEILRDQIKAVLPKQNAAQPSKKN